MIPTSRTRPPLDAVGPGPRGSTAASVAAPATVRRVAGLLLVAYGALFALSQAVHWALFDKAGLELRPVTDDGAFVATIALSAALFIFAVDTAITGRLPRPDLRRLATFMAVTLFLGITVEILLDAAAVVLIGRKSWEYQVWPRHDGHTSGVAAFMWPLYGAHLCFLEYGLRARGLLPRRQLLRSLIGGVDAMAMEIACNTWAVAVFGSYYFYYLAPDLKHFTAGEIFVPYVLTNLVLAGTVRAIERKGWTWWLWCVALCVLALAALFYPGRLAP